MADIQAREQKPLSPRPLSPHLTIYRFTLTMALSIVHRITGAALYLGTLLMVWWLVALSTDAGAYAHVARFMSSVVGQLILLGYTWALFHHMLGGIRHLIWDTGHGLDHPAREQLAWANLILGIAMTLIVWAAVSFVVR
jgi:succinate dehydrogenase / fumarate reductase, cytochrome b subunit